MEYFFEDNSTNNDSVDYITSDSKNHSPWIHAALITRKVFIPLTACIGFIGNTLCVLVFSAKSMKRSSCSVFLETLALVDNVFLLNLLLSWIDGEIYSILNNLIICQIFAFSSYVTSFLSVWLVVGFTCERFIAIRFPLRSNYLCNVFREKIAVATLLIVSVALYQFSFWTTSLHDYNGQMRCSHKIKYINFLNVVTWIDTLLTMMIPFLLIVILNSVIVRTVIKCPLKHMNGQRIKSESSSFSSSSLLKTPGSSNSKRENGGTVVNGFSMQRNSPQIRVTRTLLFVSCTFLFLNLPAHTIRLYNLISSVVTSNPEVSVEFYFLQEVTLTIYHVTFCSNFFLYTFFGRNFRKSLYKILQCKPTVQLPRNRLHYVQTQPRGHHQPSDVTLF